MEESEITPLQQAVDKLLENRGSDDELSHALDLTQERLLVIRDEFRAQVAALGPLLEKMVAAEIHAVEQSLLDYDDVLDSCAGYFDEYDREYLESARDNLPLAIVRLNVDLMRFRDVVIAERGPTTHAGLNQLMTLFDPKEVQRVKEQEQKRCLAALNGELSENEAQFYNVYLEVLQSELNFLEMRQKLQELGEFYARIDVPGVARRYMHGPTPVGPANLVINSAWLYSQNAVEPEVVGHFLEEATQSAYEALEIYQAMESAEVAPLEELLQLYNEFGDWIEQPEPERLQGLVERGRELAGRARAAFDALQTRQAEQEAGGSGCPVCGLKNPAGLTRCFNCRAALVGGEVTSFSALEGERVANGLSAAGRLQGLLDLAQQVWQGGGDSEELWTQLQQFENSLNLARKQQRPIDAISGGTPEEREELEEAGKLYGQGLEELGNALERLVRFAESPAQGPLDEATDLLSYASVHLQQAQKRLAVLLDDQEAG